MSIVQQGPTPNAGAAVSRGLITNLAQTLAGVKTFQDGIVAASQLGANAADVCNKIGTSVADGSVVQNATLLSIRSGLGGSEVEFAKFTKPGASFGGVLTLDTKSLTNCSAIDIQNSNAGANGISFAGGSTGYIGIGSGFFDFNMSNRLMRFFTNSAAFSSSPVACFLHEAFSPPASTPLMVHRAPAGFAADLHQWRVNTSTILALISKDGEFEVTTASKGVIIKSPDGTRYRIKVANGGALSTEAA